MLITAPNVWEKHKTYLVIKYGGLITHCESLPTASLILQLSKREKDSGRNLEPKAKKLSAATNQTIRNNLKWLLNASGKKDYLQLSHKIDKSWWASYLQLQLASQFAFLFVLWAFWIYRNTVATACLLYIFKNYIVELWCTCHLQNCCCTAWHKLGLRWHAVNF